jgi:hypothetical protein
MAAGLPLTESEFSILPPHFRPWYSFQKNEKERLGGYIAMSYQFFLNPSRKHYRIFWHQLCITVSSFNPIYQRDILSSNPDYDDMGLSRNWKQKCPDTKMRSTGFHQIWYSCIYWSNVKNNLIIN